MGILCRLLAVALAATVSVPAAGQQWPARALRIVTGTPPGGSPDFVSRLLADKLSERLGQTVLVEHSATTGLAAWNAVAKSQPDGYLLTMLTGAFSARAAVAKSGELINIEAGISLRGIPYRGNSQIVQDLLGGRLDVMIETGTIAFAQINGGTVRGLAVSSRRRFVLEPDIPAIAETLPGFEVMSWLGLAAPGGTARPVVERLNREVRAILELPEIRDKLAIVGNIPMPSTPEQMQDYIERDAARWSRIVDIKGIEKY
jgi:tripartite-type tricarboxylate transporter receptor subunit TctC